MSVDRDVDLRPPGIRRADQAWVVQLEAGGQVGTRLEQLYGDDQRGAVVFGVQQVLGGYPCGFMRALLC
jgi:hypothetical protein